MMGGYARAAEMEGSLDFPYTRGLTLFQQKPVNFPGFATKCILKLDLAFRVQSVGSSQYNAEQHQYKSNF